MQKPLRSEQAPAPEIQPVKPWRVPPMGSVGDAWDQYIVLPEEQLQADQARQAEYLKQRAKRKPKRRNAADVVFLDWVPSLHLGVIIAWVFVGLTLASVGRLFPLMPFMAMLAFLTGGMAVFLLNTIHTKETGVGLGIAACSTGLVFILISGFGPANKTFRTFTQTTLAAPTTALSEYDKIQRAQEDMKTLADAVYCAYLLLGEDVAAIGRESVNGSIDPESLSFRISTVALMPNKEFSALELESLYVWNGRMPPDPFADDSRATYGLAVLPGAIIVYSPGPDGVWDINPRRPLDQETTDYEAFFEANTYTPLTGKGDLILIRPHNLGGLLENYNTCADGRRNWQEAWFSK
ncbi:MAG: hypothetical protein ACFCU1_06220 [Sumerlaeia bacterium]